MFVSLFSGANRHVFSSFQALKGVNSLGRVAVPIARGRDKLPRDETARMMQNKETLSFFKPIIALKALILFCFSANYH